ncbi:MAG: RiPP maturation radical SAM protein 1 [Hyphomicrobiales bacterium]|nr:MAG: RiPP maturation radical SAM protein 1 [Hyphomicrobiales bacterium]
MPDRPNVVLANMPWATGHRPSIALAILTRLCQQEDVPVRSFYGNLDMAAVVGFEVAQRFADERTLFGLSEHLFAACMFGPAALDSDLYLEAFAESMAELVDEPWRMQFADIPFLKSLRDEVTPAFLDRSTEQVLAMNPTVVGFTSTFNQVMSSLALAQRIKAVRPDIAVIAGGACFDDEMGREYHRALPDVLDHVFMGEAEVSFVEYLRRLKDGRSTRGIAGVTSFVDGVVELVPGKRLEDMNLSPSPDYDGFFAEKDRLEAETGRVFNVETLPFESARGCWWGQKNHCTFCGINSDLMPFRAKTADRVVEEMITLSARYGVAKLTATDWIISRWHCDELFERLGRLNLDLEIFYEVRADMKKQQIVAMKAAGIVNVQPGIESFSTSLLKHMRKGTTAIKHVQFLRWCKEAGVNVAYNILAGFPGEQPEWFAEMEALIPKLRHLPPPLQNVTPIEMHRFSPLYERRLEFGVEEHDLRPDYAFNFPPDLLDPRKVAYFFSFTSSMTPKDKSYIVAVEKQLEPWLEAHKAKQIPFYEYAVGPGFLRLRDSRHGDGRYLRLADMHRDIALLCDELQTRRTLAKLLEPLYGAAVTDGRMDEAIDQLVRADILLSEGDHLLLLPTGAKLRSTRELHELVFGSAPVVASEAEPAFA